MDEPPPPPTDALLLQTYDWQRKAEAEVRKQTNKQTNALRTGDSPVQPGQCRRAHPCVPHRPARYVCMASKRLRSES